MLSLLQRSVAGATITPLRLNKILNTKLFVLVATGRVDSMHTAGKFVSQKPAGFVNSIVPKKIPHTSSLLHIGCYVKMRL